MSKLGTLEIGDHIMNREEKRRMRKAKRRERMREKMNDGGEEMRRMRKAL
jgi:hypothetical protein